MFKFIYIESDVTKHQRTKKILARFPEATPIVCERYTEVFNRKAQNFRLQKKQPALILARKHKNFILPAPDSYGIGSENNYYFSHMLNCIYDCRYCFLQGMYSSAHYVLFVNYEDFETAIREKIDRDDQSCMHFFTGYDCDSLAFDPVTGFAGQFLDFASKYKNYLFEFRTKSTQIRTFLSTETLNNIVIAFSFTPEDISKALEHKVPTIEKRLHAMQKLQDKGWTVGLRFDPIIFSNEYKEQYQELFQYLFSGLKSELIHSVSLGSFRLPKDFFQRMSRLYPEELLFASPLDETEGMISYKKYILDETMDFCTNEILNYIPENKFYPCG